MLIFSSMRLPSMRKMEFQDNFWPKCQKKFPKIHSSGLLQTSRVTQKKWRSWQKVCSLYSLQRKVSELIGGKVRLGSVSANNFVSNNSSSFLLYKTYFVPLKPIYALGTPLSIFFLNPVYFCVNSVSRIPALIKPSLEGRSAHPHRLH